MARIIVAFALAKRAQQVAAILEEAGMNVFRVCTTSGETRRAFDLCPDAILVSGYKFPDTTVSELLGDQDQQALALIVDRPELLALIDSSRAFRLPLPVTRTEILSSVNMLQQLHEMRMPHRSGDDKILVEQAKTILINNMHLTEPAAHQMMQKYSMRMGLKMTDTAKMILSGKMID